MSPGSPGSPGAPGGPPRPWWAQLFRRKPLAEHHGHGVESHRVLGAWGLTSMGIGATIGAGIFVSTGKVALEDAGPAVMLSFVLAGFACVLAGLCYAEFASLAPTGGSAYSYAYSTLGEFLAWVIGWDLVLEYAVAGSTVAVGWSQHLVELLHAVGLHAPEDWVRPAVYRDGDFTLAVNFPAALVLLAITYLLVLGVRESATANAVMVVVKVGVVLLVVLVGAYFVTPHNWVGFPGPHAEHPHPFFPFGWGGVVTGAGIVFFAYIGFDAVSTHAEETVNPRRDLPFGILVSLAVCTVLYIGVAAVVTGMVPWSSLNKDAPIVSAFAQQGGWVARAAGVVIGVGALAGMTSVMIVTFSGQARIFRAMARDGLLPRRVFGVAHPRYHTPHRSIILIGCLSAAAAALMPFDLLLEMVSVGTLLAFAIVCAAVLVLRRTDPGRERPFRCPAVWVVAPLGIAVNAYMIASLDVGSWVRVVGWLAVGLVVYFAYGYRHSVLRRHPEGMSG